MSQLPLKERIKIDYTIPSDIPKDTAETCLNKYNHLKKCLKNNKMIDVEYRIQVLKKLLQVWDKYKDEVYISNYLDLGMTEIPNLVNCFSIVRGEIIHAIDHIYEWTSPRYVDSSLLTNFATSYVQAEPLGLCLLFSAWNCNFLTLIVPLVQAIAAGNLVICKPASTAKETCKVCMKIINELPHDVVQGCAGDSSCYTELLKHKYDLFIFTGSAGKGKIVNQNIAPFLTPAILELGGQNPVIVDKTANMSNCVYNIIFGRHMLTGQACIAPEYVFVERSRFEEFKKAMVEGYKKMFTDNPIESPDLGHIVNEFHTERIAKIVNDPGEGAELLYGDKKLIDIKNKIMPPFFFGFKSIEEMKKSHLQESEIFGPVLYCAPYDKIEEAINYINEREKPLAEYLFTTDNSIKEYVKKNTFSGCLDINECLLHFANPFLPFGGVGNSGLSSYHGKWGFDNMSHIKPILDQISYPIGLRYPPYSKLIQKLLFKFQNLLLVGRKEFFKKYIRPFILIILFAFLVKMFIMN